MSTTILIRHLKITNAKITAIGDMRMSDKRGVMTGILLAWSKGDKYFLPQGNNFVVGLKIEIISF